MEKFLFLIREDVQRLQRSPEEHQQRIKEMTRWAQELADAGNYGGGEALTTNGKYVTKESVISDGPFIEAKECVSGFIFVNADNLEQAVSMAQTCPYVTDGSTVIEVRPLLITDGPRING